MSLMQLVKGQKGGASSGSGGAMNKNWLHSPEALLHGHIVYLVKLLGYIDVDQPKGTEVVKEGIRKIKFNNQIKKSEGTMTNKLPKVEFTVSVDGVTIQDPKSKAISHQYPLHRISYCADDKTDKKIFSFITKEPDSDQHTCFVFVSDKCAEDITLTVGQAFDLAYRRFLETSGKDMEMKKQNMLLQKRVQSLETENKALKLRVAELERGKDKEQVETLKQKSLRYSSWEASGRTRGFVSLSPPPPAHVRRAQAPPFSPPHRPVHHYPQVETAQASFHATSVQPPTDNGVVDVSPSPPPRQQKLRASTNPFNSDFSTISAPAEMVSVNGASQSSPSTTDTKNIPALSPPPLNSSSSAAKVKPGSVDDSAGGKDLFGAVPFDPFNSAPFPPESSSTGAGGDRGVAAAANPFTGKQQPQWTEQELDTEIGKIDQQLNEIKEGFGRGLSFSNYDFSLEDLDPLNQKQAST